MKHTGIPVLAVRAASPAARAGIRPGMRILRLDGHETLDELDLLFVNHQTEISLDVLNEPGHLSIRIRKREETDLGITTEPIRCKPCGNACIFCFADQNAPGSRAALRFKDEDYRFSFLFGHYVTLSHITERELERIGRLRLHPLYLSIHTVEDDLRRRLMGIKRSVPIRRLLDRLVELDLRFHGQIVLVPGWNDGEHLIRSVRELMGYQPNLQSLAVIPVGLTRHRDGLIPIEPVSSEWAAGVIRDIDTQVPSIPPGWLACSDELFLKAGIPVPSSRYYGDYAQLENGVGMLRAMMDGGLRRRKFEGWQERAEGETGERYWFVTGTAAYPVLRSLIERWFRGRIPSYIKLIAIRNDHFGETVTVAGLVSGRDLIRQIGHEARNDRVFIPSVMLQSDQERFIDDVTVDTVTHATNASVFIIEPGIDSLYKVLRSCLRDRGHIFQQASDA